MTILIALFKYFPWGGLQKDTLRVIEEATRRGHKVIVFTTQWDYETPAGDVSIERHKVRGVTNHGRMNDFNRQFQKRLLKHDYQVSLAMNRVSNADFYFAADSCMKTYLPHKHSSLALKLLPRYHNILRQEEAILGPESPTVAMYIAKDQFTQYTQEYKTPGYRLAELPPGMNPKCKRPPEKEAQQIRTQKRHDLNLDDSHLMLILVGTNFMRKGLDRALDAVAALPTELRRQTRLFLVGNDDRNKVEKLAQSRGLTDNFTFTGPRDDVHELLLAADVMIHPAREEGTGTVLVEALAAGLPTICTQECGFSPYVEAATHTVVPIPFEQKHLNRLLTETLTNLEELKQQTKDYAATQDFCARTDVILSLLETFERNHHRPTEEELTDIISLHREALERKSALKDTDKRKVTRVNLNRTSLIVKEFCGDGCLRNHALTSYRNSIILNRISPMPLRYLETESSHIIIFEDCGSQNCMNCKELFTTRKDVQDIFADCGRILAFLHLNGYYHNDTKASNFVVNDNCPEIRSTVALIDCDYLKRHRTLSKARRIKNLAQFLALTHQVPTEDWPRTIRTVIDAYAQALGYPEQTERAIYEEAYALICNHDVESWLNRKNLTMPPPSQVFS